MFLTPEDSKRVADALIEKINDTDIDVSVYRAIRSVLMPQTKMQWKEDWFPLAIEKMCNEVVDCCYKNIG